MPIIRLTKGKNTVVDIDDFIKFKNEPWSASWSNGTWYAKNWRGYLHRQITCAPAGLEVDHINGKSLDNRKSNLRICTHQQNVHNSRKKKSRWKYKGIYPHCFKWGAKIRGEGKNIFLGYFYTQQEAALAYDKAAKKYHGEFARTNFK